MVWQLSVRRIYSAIRVGSCGVLQPGMTVGEIIISSGAVGGGGTGNAYLPPRLTKS
jgi:uridine phosphorylase